MADNPRDSLRSQLDLLLSIHREELGDKALTEVLFAAANGLLSLLRDHARYDADAKLVEVPFAEAARLESQLEDLLTTRVICVHVSPPAPMHADLTIRIVCGPESVDLKGRAVQVTQAGTVFQLQAASVDVQRKLVSLPAILRSNPIEELVIDQRSSRPPIFVDAESARDALFGKPEAPTMAPTRSQLSTPRPPTLEREELVIEPPEPSEPSLAEATEGAEEKIAASRLAFQMPKVDGVLARAPMKNHFDFLNVHFSADRELIAAARDELLHLVEQCRRDDLNGTVSDRLDALVARLEKAWEVLGKTSSRRAHRKEFIAQFQVETALEMFERQAEAAKMSRRYDVAIDCLRCIVELNPGNHDAQMQLEALRALESE